MPSILFLVYIMFERLFLLVYDILIFVFIENFCNILYILFMQVYFSYSVVLFMEYFNCLFFVIVISRQLICELYYFNSVNLAFACSLFNSL